MQISAYIFMNNILNQSFVNQNLLIDQCPMIDPNLIEKNYMDINLMYNAEIFLAFLCYFYIYYCCKPKNDAQNDENSTQDKIKKDAKKIVKNKPKKHIYSRLIPMVYINFLLKKNLVIFVKQQNKKRGASHERYEKYKKATSVKEFVELDDENCGKKDLQWDLTHGLIHIDNEKEMELVSVMIKKCKEKEE